MKPISIKLLKERNANTNQDEVVVQLLNRGNFEVNRVCVQWEYQYDIPPALRKSPEFATSSCSAEFCELGSGPLLSGEERSFVYPSEQMKALLSVVDALSPDKYRVRVYLDHEREVISGAEFGAWITANFPS